MNKRIKYTCSVCGGKYSNRDWKKHIESKKHIENYEKSILKFMSKEFYDICCKKLLLKGLIPKVKITKGNWKCNK